MALSQRIARKAAGRATRSLSRRPFADCPASVEDLAIRTGLRARLYIHHGADGDWQDSPQDERRRLNGRDSASPTAPLRRAHSTKEWTNTADRLREHSGEATPSLRIPTIPAAYSDLIPAG